MRAFVGDAQFQVVEDDVVVGELFGEAFGHFLLAAPPAFDVAAFGGDFAQAHFVAGGEYQNDYADQKAVPGLRLDGVKTAPCRSR